MPDFLTVNEFCTKMRAHLAEFERVANDNYPGMTYSFWCWFDEEFPIFMDGVDE